MTQYHVTGTNTAENRYAFLLERINFGKEKAGWDGIAYKTRKTLLQKLSQGKGDLCK